MTLCNDDTTKSQMASKEGRRGCYEHTLDSVVMMISISRMMKQNHRDDAQLMMLWAGFHVSENQNVDGKTKKQRKVRKCRRGRVFIYFRATSG